MASKQFQVSIGVRCALIESVVALMIWVGIQNPCFHFKVSAEISHFAGKACALTLCEQDSWFYTKTHNCILQHLHPHEPTQKRRTRHTHLGRGSPSCSPSASTDESQIAQLHISRYIYIILLWTYQENQERFSDLKRPYCGTCQMVYQVYPSTSVGT